MVENAALRFLREMSEPAIRAADPICAADPLWAHACSLFDSEPMRRKLGADLQPRLLGRLLTLAGDGADVAPLLDVIPSETTPAERRFLFAFVAQLWGGRGSIVEVGPFLGGTTRALALGMLASRRRSASARLFTFDRFAHYHKPGSLRRHLEPLVAHGVLPAALLERIDAAAGFHQAFEALHASTPYASFLRAAEGWLPDDPRTEPALAHPLRLPDDGELDLIFVDGCKSWYATKAFLRLLAPRIGRGVHLIFQDYGWYTCFWIPAFVHALRDCLRLVAYVDATYAFELVSPLDANRIERCLPDSIEALGCDATRALFAQLSADATERGDLEARVFHALQEVGALQAQGEHQRAKDRMVCLAAGEWTGRPRSLIQAACRTWNLHG